MTGTAMAIAHGEAATRTTRARSIQTEDSPSQEPTTATSAAVTSTTGTRGRAMRSARRARSPLRWWASWTSLTIVVRELSVPAADACRVRLPPPLTLPASTSVPGPTSRGIDSPVMAEASTVERPVVTTPSVAIRSPAPMSRTSPMCTSVASIVTSCPSRTTRVVLGISDNSDPRPCFALSIARSSSASAIENRNASAAASPMWPRATAPIAAIVISRPTPRNPRAR